jgi:hypothetical protein
MSTIRAKMMVFGAILDFVGPPHLREMKKCAQEIPDKTG